MYCLFVQLIDELQRRMCFRHCLQIVDVCCSVLQWKTKHKCSSGSDLVLATALVSFVSVDITGVKICVCFYIVLRRHVLPARINDICILPEIVQLIYCMLVEIPSTNNDCTGTDVGCTT